MTDTALTPEVVVGRRIADARRESGIQSQNELGQRLEEYLGKRWTNYAVSEAERGLRRLDPTELLAFAAILNRPVSWFFLPPAGTAFQFPARKVPVAELQEGALVAPDDIRQTLVDDQMAILDELQQAQQFIAEQVSRLVSVSIHGPAVAKVTAKSERPQKKRPKQR